VLPILAKMTPNITRMEEPAKAAIAAGADGIAAINTIKSVMNIDLHSFSSSPNVAGRSSVGGYSGKAVKPIALRFIHDMKKEPELADVPISGMGGIETWKDAAEFIALGCGTVQVTTSVMQYGYRIIKDMLEGLSDYMVREGIQTVEDMIGQALPQLVSADELNRNTIEYPRFDRSLCVSCGRCYISCYDGGHQAIHMDTQTGQPVLDGAKCVGCQLCRLVCPAGAIGCGVRVEKHKS
jgi:dihydropyrimidine dehydrogenase (NAD+) subunit PreA